MGYKMWTKLAVLMGIITILCGINVEASIANVQVSVDNQTTWSSALSPVTATISPNWDGTADVLVTKVTIDPSPVGNYKVTFIVDTNKNGSFLSSEDYFDERWMPGDGGLQTCDFWWYAQDRNYNPAAPGTYSVRVALLTDVAGSRVEQDYNQNVFANVDAGAVIKGQITIDGTTTGIS